MSALVKPWAVNSASSTYSKRYVVWAPLGLTWPEKVAEWAPGPVTGSSVAAGGDGVLEDVEALAGDLAGGGVDVEAPGRVVEAQAAETGEGGARGAVDVVGGGGSGAEAGVVGGAELLHGLAGGAVAQDVEGVGGGVDLEAGGGGGRGAGQKGSRRRRGALDFGAHRAAADAEDRGAAHLRHVGMGEAALEGDCDWLPVATEKLGAALGLQRRVDRGRRCRRGRWCRRSGR